MAEPKSPRIITDPNAYIAEYTKLKQNEVEKQRLFIEIDALPENKRTIPTLKLAEVEIAIGEAKETLARSYNIPRNERAKLQETVDDEYVNSTTKTQITFDNPDGLPIRNSLKEAGNIDFKYNNSSMTKVTITLENDTPQARQDLLSALSDVDMNYSN